MTLIERITLAACLLISGCHSTTNMETPILSTIDHLVYATPDLAAGIEQVERLLGVKAIPGGQHPGGGTRNALIGLGGETYLEIIGPDPDQPKPPRPRRFGIDELKGPRLVTWAAKGIDLEAMVDNAKRHAIDLGMIQSGSRKRPDGVLLSWRLTVSPALTQGGIVPFFIDWAKTQHPATSLPKGCVLVALRAEHPDANRVQADLSVLGLNLRVDSGSAPSMIATIRTPNGDVELR
jgi:glyoxalase-like protein